MRIRHDGQAAQVSEMREAHEGRVLAEPGTRACIHQAGHDSQRPRVPHGSADAGSGEWPQIHLLDRHALLDWRGGHLCSARKLVHLQPRTGLRGHYTRCRRRVRRRRVRPQRERTADPMRISCLPKPSAAHRWFAPRTFSYRRRARSSCARSTQARLYSPR